MVIAISEEEFLGRLLKTAEKIDNSYQLNSRGIGDDLDELLKPEGEEIIFKCEIPESYLEVLKFRKGINRNTNQYGAAMKLFGIYEKYSELALV